MHSSDPHHPSADIAAPTTRDRTGLPLTTVSLQAAALYREATELVHGAHAGATTLLDQAVACDPEFAMAHAARWMLAHADGDAEIAQRSRAAALSLLDGLSPWEVGHIECMAALSTRRPDAWTQARAHLAAYPGDLWVAFQLIGDLFFHGRVGKRQAVMEVLLELAPHHRDDWAFQARLGFHMSELGDVTSALAILDTALSARPQAPFIAHAKAHALLESGQRAASHRFLSEWVSRHDPAGPLDGHIHWHLSLGELEAGDPEAAIQRYLSSSAPGSSHCALGLLLADAGGLFCRMLLDDQPLKAVPRAELLALLGTLDGALRIPFVAVHAAALALALDQPAILTRCVNAMDQAAGDRGLDAEQRVVKAFRSYLVGDDAACVVALSAGHATAWEEIGGSNEERALIGKLLARATVRSANAS